MALSEYSPPPLFVHGQIMSTSGHLNTLVRDTNILLGEYLAVIPGYFAPVLGDDYKGFENGSYRLFVGSIRHKRDTFAYSVHLTDLAGWNVHVRVRYGEQGDNLIAETTVPSATAVPYDVTGTIDVTKMHVGSFYEVFVDVWCAGLDGEPVGDIPAASVNYLGETYAPSYSIPPAFLIGVPTAEGWQRLSTLVEMLYDFFAEPAIAPMMCAELAPHNGALWFTGNDLTAPYFFKHKHKYLAYQFQIKTWDGVAGNGSWTGNVVYNGVTLRTLGLGCIGHEIDPDSTAIYLAGDRHANGSLIKMSTGEVIELGGKDGNDGEGFTLYATCLRHQHGTKAAGAPARAWFYDYIPTDHDPNPLTKKDYFPLKGYIVYRGLIDLSGQGLDFNASYTGAITTVQSAYFDEEDVWSVTQVDYLFETPEAEPDLSGWTPLTAHVALTSPKTCATNLRTDLVWFLDNEAAYLNGVSPHLAANGIDRGGTFARRRRYLHYYTMSSDQDGKLTFYVNGREQTQSISPGNYHWNSLDMDSVRGLWPGTIYKVTGLAYALEDDAPMPLYDLDLLNRDEDA